MAKAIKNEPAVSPERHWLNELDPIAVPTLGAASLGEEFRLRYISEALEQRKSVPRSYAIKVERVVQASKIHGHRNPWVFTSQVLASRLVQSPSTMKGLTLMQPLLPLWLDGHRGLFEECRRFLESRGFQVDKDTYRKSPRTIVQPLLDAFVAESAGAKADPDAANLIIHCVVVNVVVRRQAGATDDAGGEGETVRGSCSVACREAVPVTVGTIWGRWLEELKALDDDQTEWEGACEFADEVRALYQAARARQELRSRGVQRLRDAYVALVSEMSKEISSGGPGTCRAVDFFNASDLSTLDLAVCPLENVEQAIEAIHASGEALTEWVDLLALPASRTDAKARRARQDEVEERIEGLLEIIRTSLARPGPQALEEPTTPAFLPAEPAEFAEPSAVAEISDEHEDQTDEASESDEAEIAAVAEALALPPEEQQEAPGVAEADRDVDAPEDAVPEREERPEVEGDAEVEVAPEADALDESVLEVAILDPYVSVEAPSSPVVERSVPSKAESVVVRPADSRVAACALKALESHGDEQQRALEDLMWELVAEGKPALAWHVSRFSHLGGGADFPRLAPWILRASVLAPAIQTSSGDIARELTEAFAAFDPSVFRDGSHEFNNAVRFMLAACCLRASILAPATGAASILQTFVARDGMQQFYEYCQALGGYGVQLQPIEVGLLMRVRAGADLERERERLRDEVEAWMKRAPGFGLVYQPATIVWQTFVREDGLLGRLLRTVRNDDRAERQKVFSELTRLRSEDEIEREVLQTDRRPARLVRLAPIGYMAIKQIRKHADEALEFLERWLDLHDGDDDANRGYLQKIAEGLRTAVFSKHGEVLRELQAFITRGSREVAAAASCCRDAVESVRLLFENGHQVAVEPDPVHLLHAELLKVPGLRLSEDWALETAGEEALAHLLRYLSLPPLGWQEAFDQACEIRDHWTTERIVEVVAMDGQPAGVADSLRDIRSRRIEECGHALERDLETTRKEIEHAVAYGVLAESDRATAIIVLERLDMRRQRREISRFDEAHRQLRDILEQIASRRKKQVEEARTRLVQAGIPSNSPNMLRILEALECGDVFSANEYIGMTQSGEELPTVTDHPDTFRDFFEAKFDRLDDFLTPPQMTLRHVAAIVREGRSAGPIDMRRVPGAQAKEAGSLLEAWDEMKRREVAEEAQVRVVLGHLGFRVQRLDRRRQSSRAWLDLVADRLEDRELCPVAFFGSEAKGRYRILCVWRRPSEEEIVREVGETSHGEPPTLVFHFGRMTKQRRRDLAKNSRARRRSLVVIDDQLVVYLAGERGSRLPVMFECGLPFSFLEPFTTTAGLVSPEMFFGRRRQRDSIIRPDGSCFIYGGRQLGKTALLRDVERRYHEPEKGRIVRWIDLKAEGIAEDRSLDDFWMVLASELHKLGVLPQGTGYSNAKTILDRVDRWLADDAHRRVLLLLDEADNFLRADAEQNFRDTVQLKGLMDRSGRRFKVVFAGLHNVQRTTRLVNHPLAHYGDAICIGPLLESGEWREARALVRRPFEVMGYRFESEDLITRILSQTNYYPSLIQLYCQWLLRSLSDPRVATFDWRTCPPYEITQKHVEETYKNKDLREQIHRRFQWTLQLDSRYELLAYVIAHAYLQGEDPEGHGFSLGWARDRAVFWWPEGFAGDASVESFSVLLDEMVGLGVLRHVGEDRYTLRSPNLALLMGTAEQIGESVLAFVGKKPEPAYEAAKFRRPDPGTPSRRSPMTAEQESSLKTRANGVTVVCGSEASGIEDLPRFLAMPFAGEQVFLLEDGSGREAFFNRLATVIDQRAKQEGTSLLYVPPTCSWTIAWIEETLRRLSRLTSRKAFVRVVFGADPRQTLALLQETRCSNGRPEGVDMISLKPWSDSIVRHWLGDNGFGAQNDALRKRLEEVTGYWPAFLYELLERRNPLRSLEQELDELEASLQDPKGTRRWLNKLGLAEQGPRHLLGYLADLGQMTDDELGLYAEGTSHERIGEALRWADLLRLVDPVGEGRWRLEPVAARLLSHTALPVAAQ